MALKKAALEELSQEDASENSKAHDDGGFNQDCSLKAGITQSQK